MENPAHSMRHLMLLLEAVVDDKATIAQAIEYIWQNAGDSDNESCNYAVADILGLDYDVNNGWGDHEPDAVTYKQAFAEWAKDRIDQVIYEIGRRFQANRLTVWREITAPEDWQPTDDRHLGIYWSWDQHAAEAHWAGSGVAWLLTGSVTSAAIDWVTTLAVNADPTLGEDEKEIRLHENAPVELLNYKRS